jgi:signal peptidase I
MSLFRSHRSYTERVFAARSRRRAAGKLIIFLALISFISTFFLKSYVVEDNSMAPALQIGDRILASPLPVGAVTFFGKLPPLRNFRRGDIVVILPDPVPSASRLFRLWDSIVRFASLQRISPMAFRYGKALTSPSLGRVTGLPGETIRFDGTQFLAKAASSPRFVEEEYLYDKPYNAKGEGVPSMGDVQLGEGQYFIACDDRSLFAGSLQWGPVRMDRIAARVVAITWPLRRIRIP